MQHESEEFAIRRGELWTGLRNGVPRVEVAAESRVSVGTIKNVERGKDPTLENFRRLIEHYKPDDETVLSLLGVAREADVKLRPVGDGAALPAHQKVLRKFEGMSYNVYYVRDAPDSMRTLCVSTLTKEEGGHLRASATQSDREYECLATCNSSASFVQFQLASDLADASDLVSVLIPHPQELKPRQKFRAGVGAILSLSSLGGGNDTPWPCFQLAAIVDQELAKQLGEDIVIKACKEHITLPLDDNELPGFGYRIGIIDIHKRSHDLYRILVPKDSE